MRVLVVYYRNKSTFIQRDIDILSKHFDVDEISIRKVGDVFSLIRKIRKSDIVYIWFAGKHAGISVFIAKLFNKKSIVVVGGYDVVNIPEIGHGLWYNGSVLDKLLCKYAIFHADFVMPVSKSHKKEMIKITKSQRYKVVYNGIPTDFCKDVYVQKDNIIATTAYINREQRIKVKGIDYFWKIAEFFPKYTFIIIGVEPSIKQKIEKVVPKNVKILSPKNQQELQKIYQKTKIYCQLSVYESFGIAVVEAMQCGCIPVVTNRGALPEVVGDAGVVVEYGNVKNIVRGVKEAIKLAEREERREKAIQRAKKFSLEKREKMLIQLLNDPMIDSKR